MTILKPWLLAFAGLLFCSFNLFAEEPLDEIEEIVVTADFRERPLDEFPASVTVLGAELVEQLSVQHFEELVNVVPNLNWSGDGHRARYFQIRGVGELEQYQGAPNPSVGFLIDDMDFSGIGTVATLFDMESVEVLRGPQGSRYGANALAGLVYMRSTAPSVERNGRLQFVAADDDAFSGGVAFGGALTSDERALYRFSAHHHRSNGFRDNPYLGRDDTNGRDETTIRGRLRLQPSDVLDTNIAILFSRVDDGYDAWALDNGYTVLSDNPGKDAQESLGISARIDWAGLGFADFTSITSVADSDIEFSFDADWGNADSWAPVTYDYTSVSHRDRRTFSQEFRLVSNNVDGSLDWLAGLYVLNLDEDVVTVDLGDYYDPGYDFADSLDNTFGGEYSATNLALFGQLDKQLATGTRVGLGLRLERRNAEYADSELLAFDPSESMWGGELSLSHELSENANTYVTLSKGYKAGGFNLGQLPDDLRQFTEEEVWNLEAGVRSVFLGGGLHVNAATFASRHDNQQVRASYQLVPGDPTTFRFVTINVDGEMLGFETDLRWIASDAWEFYASVGLLDATFKDTGRGQAHAPEYTLALGGKYQHPSGFFGRVDVAAKDGFYFDVSHDQKSTSYEIVNARLGYDGDTWLLQLWARNLFNETHAVRGFYFGNEPPDFPDTLYTRQGDPRQLGLTLERRF
jgi:outer membrane receptor protein involved in Fe transport